MKILLAPSKTKKLSNNPQLSDQKLLFPKEHKKIVATLRKLTKKDVKRVMKIDNELLDNVYSSIKDYHKNESYHAFPSFDGLVFKNLQKDLYKAEEYAYIEKYVFILDAFYGLLEAGTKIKDYRLNFTMKLGINLYDFWNIDEQLDEPIINLASKEYIKMVKKPYINIEFLQHKNGKYINQATYSKQARGKMLNYMILHKITSIEDLKDFSEDNYQFNSSLSSKNNLVFTR